MRFFFNYWHQSYQLAEDLGRAFSDRAILQTFIDAEANVSAGSLKVRNIEITLVFFYIFLHISLMI
jgi:hypothetical protein